MSYIYDTRSLVVKEGCAASITSSSICLFCELREKIDRQQEGIVELRKEIANLSGKIGIGDVLCEGDNCSGEGKGSMANEIPR